jgi:hypothetical protein
MQRNRLEPFQLCVCGAGVADMCLSDSGVLHPVLDMLLCQAGSASAWLTAAMMVWLLTRHAVLSAFVAEV